MFDDFVHKKEMYTSLNLSDRHQFLCVSDRLTSNTLLLDRVDSINNQNNEKIARIVKMSHFHSTYVHGFCIF